MIEQLLLIYVMSAVCWFVWNVWVYYTGARLDIEQLKTHLNNRDKRIEQLDSVIIQQRKTNDYLSEILKENENSIAALKNIIQTNKIGETMAKKPTKTKTKKPMKK